MILVVSFCVGQSLLGSPETVATECCQQRLSEAAAPVVPSITSPATLVVEFGQEFEYKIEATNQPLGYSVKSRPFWLKLEGHTLVGRALKLGSSKITLIAINQHGVSKPFELKFDVVPAGQTLQ